MGFRRGHARRLGARAATSPCVTSAEDVKGLDWLFYVGSAESFDPRGQKIARAFAQILLQAGVKFAILGAAETSTGESVRRTGNEMLFQTLAKQLVATLNGLGVTRIVTCDPHAFNTLRNEYPEFGGHYEVIHHTQLLRRLLAEGTDQGRTDFRARDPPRSLLSRPAQRRVRCPAIRAGGADPR